MKKLIISLAIITGLVSCSKKDVDKDKTPVRSFTATLDLRPSNNDGGNVPVATNRNKNVFLSFSKGRVYNMDEAKLNAEFVDMVMYDGNTIATAIGSVRIISPGGGGFSLSGGSVHYSYLKPGTINEPVRYYNLLEMADWTRFNQSQFSVPLNEAKGITEASFNAIANTDDLTNALKDFKDKNPEAAGSEKAVLNTGTGVQYSKFFRATYEMGGKNVEALVHIKELRYLPNGYMSIDVKTFP